MTTFYVLFRNAADHLVSRILRILGEDTPAKNLVRTQRTEIDESKLDSDDLISELEDTKSKLETANNTISSLQQDSALLFSSCVAAEAKISSLHQDLVAALSNCEAAEKIIVDLSGRFEESQRTVHADRLINASRIAGGAVTLCAPSQADQGRTIYADVISLGSWCQTSEQLRLHNIIMTSGPFDWGFASYKSLRKAICSNMSGLFDRSDLELVMEGWSVRDKKYDLMPHHLFSRDANGMITSDIIEREYADRKSKVNHLVDKWRSRTARAGPTLYVWAVNKNWLDGSGPMEAALDIQELLRTEHPDHAFDLLVVQEGPFEPAWKTPGIFNRYVRPFAGPETEISWVGDFDSWTVLLEEFRLRDCPAAIAN